MAWCQAAAPSLLPASGSLWAGVPDAIKQGWIGLLWCRSLWPCCAGVCGWGMGCGWGGGGSPGQDPARLASSPETLKGSEPEAERPE